jgi:hypothetical protein
MSEIGQGLFIGGQGKADPLLLYPTGFQDLQDSRIQFNLRSRLHSPVYTPITSL